MTKCIESLLFGYFSRVLSISKCRTLFMFKYYQAINNCALIVHCLCFSCVFLAQSMHRQCTDSAQTTLLWYDEIMSMKRSLWECSFKCVIFLNVLSAGQDATNKIP